MDRAQKAESIESLKGVFADAGSVVVTHNLGLTVAEMTDLRDRLRKEGYAVDSASDGEEGLAKATQLPFDLIVLDVMLPIMDGWQTLAAMRSNARFAHIPVVAATAYYSAETAHDTREAGFDAYFEKPLNPRLFVQDIARLIDN